MLLLTLLMLFITLAAPMIPIPAPAVKGPPAVDPALPNPVGVEVEFKSSFGYRTAVGFTG